MGRVEKTVFISYRRRTDFSWAQAIFENLTQHGYDVFFDVNGIASGDFEQVIVSNIEARAHFLVVLTSIALERCGEPGDWLRREIETAIETERNIVPLMLDGFDFGAPGVGTALTGRLAELKNYNGLPIPLGFFDEAMQRLREKYLNVALDTVLHPASPYQQQGSKEQQVDAGTAPAVLRKDLTAQQWLERALKTADLDERLRFLCEAICLQPDASTYDYMGITRQVKGDLVGALQDFDEAIRVKPDYVDGFIDRGKARQAKGDLDGALQDYTEAIRLKPDDAHAFIQRGSAYYAKWSLRAGGGDRDLFDAVQDYQEALRLKPDNADKPFLQAELTKLIKAFLPDNGTSSV